MRLLTELHVFSAEIDPNRCIGLIFTDYVSETAATAAANLNHGLALQCFESAYHTDHIVIELKLEDIDAFLVAL